MFSLRALQREVITVGLTKASASLPVRSFSTLKLEKDLYKDGKKKPYHFPYEKIPWNFLTRWWDPFTKKKFNENTKIIQIDGNIAAGKEEFGKRLAEHLGMKWVGQPDLNDIYINGYGFDYRSLNDKLPEKLRTCDLEMWHEDPGRESTCHMQHFMFVMRIEAYVDALAHLFNTGQGVVMERSFFTERAIMEAMHKMGWLPIGFTREDGAEFYDWRYRYNHIRKLMCRNVPAPHLTIYLDVPVDECMKRIKDSKDPVQRNSKALTPQFLTYIEDWYKTRALEDQAEYGWVKHFDNTKPMNEDEIMDAIDDIRELDFDIDPHDSRFTTWNVDDRIDYWSKWRRKVTAKRLDTMIWIIQPEYDIAGYGDRISQADLALLQGLIEGYSKGYTMRKEFDPKHAPLWKILTGYENYRTYDRSHLYANFM